MNSFNYKKLYKLNDFDKLIDLVNNFDDSEWFIDTARQDAYQAHKDTTSVILKKADLFAKEIVNLYTRELFPVVENMLPVELLDTGEVVNLLFAKLPTGKQIPNHTDSGFMLTTCRRFHVPIITNDGVEFTINNESFNMEKGYVYEINNNVTHSVVNNGGKDRIHLIFDIKV
jgi:aspartyl/asparaginyl beta-hydroxylase (cupin superfamily)